MYWLDQFTNLTESQFCHCWVQFSVQLKVPEICLTQNKPSEELVSHIGLLKHQLGLDIVLNVERRDVSQFP